MARRNVGRSVPYLEFEQRVCHPNRRKFRMRPAGIGVGLITLGLACNVDEGVIEKPVSVIGHTATEGKSPQRALKKAMTQRGPIRRFTVAT